MNPLKDRVSRFFVRLLLFLAVLIPTYLLIWPTYQSLVLRASNLLLACVAPWTRLRIEPSGSWTMEYGGTALRPAWYLSMTDPEFGRQVFLALAILLGLLLAMPIRLSMRLRMALLGAGLMTLFYVASTAACAGVYGLVCRGSSTPFCENLMGTLSPGSQIAAVALWVFLTRRVFFDGFSHGKRA